MYCMYSHSSLCVCVYVCMYICMHVYVCIIVYANRGSMYVIMYVGTYIHTVDSYLNVGYYLISLIFASLLL